MAMTRMRTLLRQTAITLGKALEMPVLAPSALPERLLARTHFSSWPLASLAVGGGLYLLFVVVAVLHRGWTWLATDAHWRTYHMLTPALISYLLLIRPLVSRLLERTLEAFRGLLPATERHEALLSTVRHRDPGHEWMAVGLGAVAGWALLRPWHTSPPGLGFLAYELLSDGLLFGLLGWTVFDGLATAHGLAALQRHARRLGLHRLAISAPLTRWTFGSALLLVAGIALSVLFVPQQDLLQPERSIVYGMVVLVVAFAFLRGGATAALLSQFRILRAVVLFATIVLAGTLGYHRLEGWSLLDGLYMTVITMTTVGYAEVRPLSELGRLFTIVLSLASIGIGGYAISAVVAFVVGGDFQRILRGRRMDKQIAQLENHIIVCGLGRVGQAVATELHETQTPFVIVEQEPDMIQALKPLGDVLHIVGDATKDATLRMAGITRARGLVAALRDDKDNAFAVLTARSLQPDLRIVARLSEEENEEKLRQVGADEIVSPNAIGGLRMASLLIRPTAVTFLDDMLRAPGQTVRMEELRLDDESALIGRTLGQAHIGRQTGLLVVAIRAANGEYRVNPGSQTQLQSGDCLIVTGTPEQVAALRALNRRRNT